MPNNSNTPPWAISPNMTPKKNGKVTVVNIDGLTYWYRGMPYVFVIYCAMAVYELVSNAVGGLLSSSS